MPAPQILRTTRNLPKEDVGYQDRTGLDGQGAPSYGSSVDLSANVVEYDTATSGRGSGAQFVTAPDGSIIRTPLTLYVEGDSLVVPAVEARIALSDGRSFIVAEVAKVAGLLFSRHEPDHYRVRCKVED
jgi:hypothetical protein